MRRLFFLFIDGIGLGIDNLEINPLLDLFSPLLGKKSFSLSSVPLRGEDFVLLPIDACLGVEGRPQSATGQTTFMTGINAPQLLGYHMQAFPNDKLIALLREENLFIPLKSAGIPVSCANLYSQDFLDERKARHKNMLPVSALSIEAAGIPYRFFADYAAGRALFADITNRSLRKRGLMLPSISPAEGAERIVNIMNDYRFVFFEYFLTDSFGHGRDYEALSEEVKTLNGFLSRLKTAVDDPEDGIDILITSDHGNAEDNRSGDHSKNPVPFFLASRDQELLSFAERSIEDLTDIKPFILSFFGLTNRETRRNR
jgi:2,3-bisphosphoglycerate-independent phosphoglycerate mutase